MEVLSRLSDLCRVAIAATVSAYFLAPNATAQTLDEAFYSSTVLITHSRDPGRTEFGSGFIIFRESTSGITVTIPSMQPKIGRFFLITNKHVLPLAGRPRQIRVRVQVHTTDYTGAKEVPLDIAGEDGRNLPIVKLHPDPDVDVAGIDITAVMAKEKIYIGILSSNLLGTRDKLRDLGVAMGDEVYLLGYPQMMYDPQNVSPILRLGAIATDPTEFWHFNVGLRRQWGLPEKLDGFLVDGNVYPGSSGSMVVLRPQGTSRGSVFSGGPRSIPYILGIVSGSIPIVDNAIGSVQRMGMGTVYSADDIKEVLDLFR